MNPVIQWLESPDGEAWSRSFHGARLGQFQYRDNLITVKDDSTDEMSRQPVTGHLADHHDEKLAAIIWHV